MTSKNFQPVATAEDFEQRDGMLQPTATAVPNDSGRDGIFAVGSMSIDAVGEEVETELSNFHLYCCNCCCDMRRAVIVVNAIAVVWNILSLIATEMILKFMGSMGEDFLADFDDDIVIEEMEDMDDGFFEDMAEGVDEGIELLEYFTLVMAIIAIGLYLCGIYGAMYYKRWAVITALVAHSINLVFSLYVAVSDSVTPLDAILAGLFLYPHYFMLKQMNAGVMNPQNYHRISNCCGGRKM